MGEPDLQPASYLTLPPGTPIVDRFGQRIGRVERVLLHRHEVYERLLPPAATPVDEICACAAGTPIKLASAAGLGFNPLRCLKCNLEVPPERLGFGRELADRIATWLRSYGAIDTLELESGSYESWARAELLGEPSEPQLLCERDRLVLVGR